MLNYRGSPRQEEVVNHDLVDGDCTMWMHFGRSRVGRWRLRTPRRIHACDPTQKHRLVASPVHTQTRKVIGTAWATWATPGSIVSPGDKGHRSVLLSCCHRHALSHPRRSTTSHLVLNSPQAEPRRVTVASTALVVFHLHFPPAKQQSRRALGPCFRPSPIAGERVLPLHPSSIIVQLVEVASVRVGLTVLQWVTGRKPC